MARRRPGDHRPRGFRDAALAEPSALLVAQAPWVGMSTDCVWKGRCDTFEVFAASRQQEPPHRCRDARMIARTAAPNLAWIDPRRVGVQGSEVRCADVGRELCAVGGLCRCHLRPAAVGAAAVARTSRCRSRRLQCSGSRPLTGNRSGRVLHDSRPSACLLTCAVPVEGWCPIRRSGRAAYQFR